MFTKLHQVFAIFLTALAVGGFMSTASAGGVTLGAGVLYVPEGDDGFSGDPSVDGTPIEAGLAFVVNGSVPLGEGLRIQGEFLYYESETNETRTLPGVGPVKGTLDLEGLGGFVNLLYDFGTLLESDRLILEAGAGVGYASFKNTVTTTVAGFSSRASDRDEAFGGRSSEMSAGA